MARLPGVADLGATPPVEGARPVGSYNPAPLEEAGQQLGAGVEKLGAGVGEVADLQARYQFMTAHADYLAKSIALESQFANDQDFATLPQRYGDAATALRDQTAQTIASPGLRDRFLSSADENIARGTAQMQTRALRLSNNADIANVQSQGSQLATTFAATPDEAARHQIIGTYGALVDSLAAKGAITPEQALAEKQRWGHQVASADALTRIQNGDAQGVLNELRTAPSSPDQIDDRIIQVESGGNPLARSTSSHAFGAGQFEPATWLSLVRATHPEYAALPDDQVLALRADPALSRQMVAANRAQNTSYLQGKGVAATPGNIYLAHFLGPAAATAVVQASPNMPVSLVLSQAVGADKAAAMMRANPSVLQGMTAGSVQQWAASRMGGVGPGGGHLYDLLTPDVRAQLIDRAQGALQKQNVSAVADLRARVADTRAEAATAGVAKTPVTQEEFVAALGPQRGLDAYQSYATNLQTAADLHRVAQMSPADQNALIASYSPGLPLRQQYTGNPLEPHFTVAPDTQTGYADQARRQQQIRAAVTDARHQRDADPAGFAIAHLPAVQDAYAKFADAAADPSVAAADKAALARDFAIKQTLEQERVGVARGAVRILPKSYVDNLDKTISAAATAEDPQTRVGVIGKVQQEAALWGDQWPAVMRQLAPSAQPIVRAIAAGADPTAMTRLLSLPTDEAKRPAAIMAQQNNGKLKDLTDALNQTFAPFRGSLVGRQLDRDYPGYYSLGTELGALYMRDGLSASDAAAKAYNDLVGARYDFRDSYRIPKSAGVSPDDVQAGVGAVRARLSSFPISPAIDDLALGAPANAADSFAKLARDGRWVTTWDNTGLNLAYNGNFVRTTDGKPFALTWAQLANLGAHAPPAAPPQDVGTAREYRARSGIEARPQ